jgi:hypothetical protein
MYELQNYCWKIKKSALAVSRLQINFFSRITRPQAKKCYQRLMIHQHIGQTNISGPLVQSKRPLAA